MSWYIQLSQWGILKSWARPLPPPRPKPAVILPETSSAQERLGLVYRLSSSTWCSRSKQTPLFINQWKKYIYGRSELDRVGSCQSAHLCFNFDMFHRFTKKQDYFNPFHTLALFLCMRSSIVCGQSVWPTVTFLTRDWCQETNMTCWIVPWLIPIFSSFKS